MGFFDGGGKAVKFDTINQGASGYIVGQHDIKTGQMVPYLESQQTDYTTKEPKTYKDGNPVMQVTVLLQTDERLDDDDDGQRTVYVNKTRMKRAIQKALRDAGQGDLAIGGVLTIWMTGTEAAAGGGSPAKMFQASYIPPAGGLSVAPAPVAAPVAAPPVAAAPPAPVAAPPAPPAPVAAPPAPVAAPPAPVAPPTPAAPPVAAAPAAVAPPAPPAAPYTPPAPVAAPPAPVAAPAAPAAGGSDLPF